MFFLPLPFVLAEILIFTTWIHFYDFWNVILAYFAPCLLGALLLARSGQGFMMTLRGGVTPGQMPGKALLHQGARFFGALLLLVPLFLTRILAVILIVPGLRHAAIWFFKTFLFHRLANSRGFSFIKFGGPGPGFGGPFGAGPGFGGPGFGANGGAPFGSGPQNWDDVPQERDATVVDITPLEITHTPGNQPSAKETPSKK